MKAYSLDFRCLVINAYESGEGTIEEVAERFGVSTAFVKKMLRRHRAGESLVPRHGGGAQAKLDAAAREELRAAVARHPDATLGELQTRLRRAYQVAVSASTVCRELQRLAVPRKKKSFVAGERNARKRRAFWRAVAELKAEDFVFVDEMGIHLGRARAYGRATPGERVVETKPSTRGGNVSVIGALGADALRAARSVPGAVDGDVCLVFTKEVLARRLRPGNIVFMDNVPTHKMSALADAINAVGARVKFLPPYSPDFSPLELCGSKVKTFLRSVAARTRKHLDAALRHALATITREDIAGWFTHCGYGDPLN